MFLEIHFTKLPKLAKLTNIHSSVSLHILHPDVLCAKYTTINFTNEVQSKAFYRIQKNILYCTNPSLMYKLYSLHRSVMGCSLMVTSSGVAGWECEHEITHH